MKLFVVEDDKMLAKELVILCQKWGFDAKYAQDFSKIHMECMEYRPDMILMDINLPYYDGFYWCERIREISIVPVLFLSSRDQNGDKVMAMAAGGDDYMEKPFDSELLLIKIRSMLRRTYEYKTHDRDYIRPDMYYDYGTGRFVYKEKWVELTKSEGKIMMTLLEQKGSVVSREKLMQHLWNTDEFVTDASLTVLISRLRMKLSGICGGEDVICTKKGIGYYIK